MDPCRISRSWSCLDKNLFYGDSSPSTLTLKLCLLSKLYHIPTGINANNQISIHIIQLSLHSAIRNICRAATVRCQQALISFYTSWQWLQHFTELRNAPMWSQTKSEALVLEKGFIPEQSNCRCENHRMINESRQIIHFTDIHSPSPF